MTLASEAVPGDLHVAIGTICFCLSSIDELRGATGLHLIASDVTAPPVTMINTSAGVVGCSHLWGEACS